MSLLLDFGSAARQLQGYKHNGGSETGNWAGPLTFVLVTITLAVFFTYPLWIKLFRTPKTFLDLTFSRKRYMEAHIALAGNLVPCGETVFAPSFEFVNNYLQTNFSDVYYDFKEDYAREVDEPATLKSLTSWLNHHLDKEQKQEMIRFAKELRRSHIWIQADEDSRQNLKHLMDQLTVTS